MPRPILSIIIPTKNRSIYLLPIVCEILKGEDPDLEVVVQDNSDDDKAETGLKLLASDSRLRYNRSREKLSMSDNFAEGLRLSTGEYIAFLGDDDGINPELMAAVRWAKAKGLDAVVGSPSAKYYWPDVAFTLYGGALSGSLAVKPFTGRVDYPDPGVEILRCVHNAGLGFGKLPKIYHGAVRREFMEKVLDGTGTYFPGPTPDMSGAVAVANYVRRYAYVDYPLFISGTGKRSGGGTGAAKKAEWTIESVPWFSRQHVEAWSDLVPRFCNATTLWSEDVIQALKAVGRGDRLKNYNALYLYARCLVLHPTQKAKTWSSIHHYVRGVRSNRFKPYFWLYYY